MTTFCCTISTARVIEINNPLDFFRINKACRRYNRGEKITNDTWVEVTLIKRSKLWLAIWAARHETL
mgnify:CR=1 FL=1